MLPPDGYSKAQPGMSAHDHCLFMLHRGSDFMASIVYIDDVQLTDTNPSTITALKDFLDKTSTIKDLGQATYFLGLEITRGAKGTYINQRKYILDLMKDTNCLDSKPASTPLPSGIKLQK